MATLLEVACSSCHCGVGLGRDPDTGGGLAASSRDARQAFFRGSPENGVVQRSYLAEVKMRGKSMGSHKRTSRRMLTICMAEPRLGFLGKLGRVLKEKAQSDFDRVFSGTSKTREGLRVVDELLTYWNIGEAENILDELEDALLVSDFGPKTATKVIDPIRKAVKDGSIKSGDEIRLKLKEQILKLLTDKISSTELRVGNAKPAVIMICGVNGGGKTTTVGKLAHRFIKDGSSVLLAAGDTFRAAASEQLDVWAQRTGAEIVTMEMGNKDPVDVLTRAVKKGKEDNYDLVLADTSGRLHTNYGLMDELKNCKKAMDKQLRGAPNEVLLVLDGTTGLNMLTQAREFNQVVGITGLVLTKLDGTSRGGCVVSVVDELRIPVKFVGLGEGLEDLQPFDPQVYVDALFPS